MKILFISAASSIHTVRWVNSLIKRGNQVTLVSLPNHKEDKDKINSAVQIEYLPISGSKGYYLNAVVLKKIHRKIQPDVVNVHYASGYGTLARVAHIPSVILSVWGSDVYDFPYQSKWKMKVIKRNLRYAGRIASTSHVMAEQVRKLIGDVPIAVTPFGVDTKIFKPTYTANVDLIRNISNEKKFVFGIVKTLSPNYGVATIIKAFGIFLQKISKIEREKVCLEIYGTGELKEKLQALAQELHIEDKIYFGGYVENIKVPAVLKRMDVFLLGSENESFGVAAVEAMACGLPVIATNASGLAEVIVDGITGFLVPIGDCEKMAEKMLVLYGESELRKNMGEAGHQRVKELYDWEKNVDVMIRLYKG